MGNNTILYRGSLKSCNYRCSYCPFSKHRMSEKELERDREQWSRFCSSLEERAPFLDIGGLMVVPYGEALIHSWYWEGLAHISTLPVIDCVGAQTNFSFPVEQSLQWFQQAGGKIEKLRLWATFHPEMISPEQFAEAVRKVRNAGILLCAGAVGVPENLDVIKKLRNALPEEVYLWINKMDGLKRPYSQKEQEAFQQIDPYFFRELTFVHADQRQCERRLFVEADGRMRTCNIGPFLEENWYTLCSRNSESNAVFPPPKCNQKRCSCYLAYGGRNGAVNRVLFGSYPLFRIPSPPKAAFLDIDGTLIFKGESSVSKFNIAGLEALAKENKTTLFFATTLPYEEAMKRCREIRHLFSGGIFAGGAHLKLEYGYLKKEQFFTIQEDCISVFEKLKKKHQFRILTYRNQSNVYKITLVRPKHMPWRKQEAEILFRELSQGRLHSIRYFIEGHCLEILSAKADKASGVRLMCEWMGISPREAAAVGNDEEDEGMMRICREWYPNE